MFEFVFGLNPLGINKITGWGAYQVQYPHDRESSYTKEMGGDLNPVVQSLVPYEFV
jgi:hypothetical protein